MNAEHPSKSDPAAARVVIKNSIGFHATTSKKIVDSLESYGQTDITMTKGDYEVNAKSIIGVLTLVAVCGDELTIKAEGPMAEEAVRGLVDLIEKEFFESDCHSHIFGLTHGGGMLDRASELTTAFIHIAGGDLCNWIRVQGKNVDVDDAIASLAQYTQDCLRDALFCSVRDSMPTLERRHFDNDRVGGFDLDEFSQKLKSFVSKRMNSK